MQIKSLRLKSSNSFPVADTGSEQTGVRLKKNQDVRLIKSTGLLNDFIETYDFARRLKHCEA